MNKKSKDTMIKIIILLVIEILVVTIIYFGSITNDFSHYYFGSIYKLIKPIILAIGFILAILCVEKCLNELFEALNEYNTRKKEEAYGFIAQCREHCFPSKNRALQRKLKF